MRVVIVVVKRHHLGNIFHQNLYFQKKDKKITDNSFRKDLITVQSYDEHNLSKSNDGECLIISMDTVVGNNGIAYIHTVTKVARRIRRAHSLLKVVKEGEMKVKNNSYPIPMSGVNTHRLYFSFEAIARAIYYHECNE